MITMEISKDRLDHARKRTPVSRLAGSHRGHDASLIGAIGETVFEECLRDRHIGFLRSGSTKSDIVVAGKSFEIKTKERYVSPRHYFECSVPLYNFEHQDVYGYVFVSVESTHAYRGLDRLRCAHILGWCTREDLMNLGRVFETGQIDPSNGTRFWTSCMNIRVDQLREFKK